MKLHLVLMALLCAQALQAHAHSYFTAVAFSEDLPSPATAVLTLFEHADAVHWTLNVTDAAPGALSASIVDGNPPSSVATVVTLAADLEVGEDGTLSAQGVFGAEDFDPAFSSMSVDDLKEHVDMGHIFLGVGTVEGSLYGVVEQDVDVAAADGDVAGDMVDGVDMAGPGMEGDAAMDHGGGAGGHSMHAGADMDDADVDTDVDDATMGADAATATGTGEGEEHAGHDHAEHDH